MAAPPPPARPGGRLAVLVGPTAAGKSALALEACEAVGGEIVSADSGQVYRGLDVGTAKPTAAERARVPHHGLDLVEPTEPIDAAAWAAAADAAIADVRARGRVPLVVGGTGLYVRALLHGLSPVPEVDPAVRARVLADLEARGPEALHRDLARVDPEAAARIAPRDRQRVARALEVHEQTGRPLSAWQAEHAFAERRYEATVLGLWPPRDALHAALADRVARMLAAGWVEEVRGLLARGVPEEAPGLRTLGYRDVVAFLRGEVDGGALAERITGGHRRYARRQLTWFRGVTAREDGLVHLDPRDPAARTRLLEAARAAAPTIG